jgi:IS30 family transposase
MQILTQYEREQIAFSVKLKRGIREIARRLKRDPGVICRELKRNRSPDGRYDPLRAQTKANRRAIKTNHRKLEIDWELHDWVEAKLREGWSPELIAGRLKRHPPATLRGATVSHEQIYEYIYQGDGRFEAWYRLLHRKHRRRHPRYGRKPQKQRILERISIHDRPFVIDERQRVGDWESDLTLYQKQTAALSVQYERKLMLTRLHRVANKSAEENSRAIRETLYDVPVWMTRSLTFDNGGENVCHTGIRNDFGIDTFFCDPYSAWQKGGVENAIGLIRRYLPKHTDLATLTDDDLYRVQERINNRPRKKHNYQTPNEALGVALNS